MSRHPRRGTGANSDAPSQTGAGTRWGILCRREFFGWDVLPAAHCRTDLVLLLFPGLTRSSGFIETVDVLVRSVVMGSDLELLGQPPGVGLNPYVCRES